MSFANPLSFLLFLPLGFAAWRLLRNGRNQGIRFSAVSRLRSFGGGWRSKLARLTPYVMLSGLSLLVIAAARPRSPLSRESRSVDAIAIAMTVDVSGSMEALDLAPEECLRGERPFTDEMTRLAVVKRIFAQFVERRPDDLIGLVTFGTYASTRSPLTADHDALLNVLKGVQVPSAAVDAEGRLVGSEGESNTAIGDGLATALLRLREAQPKSRVIILLSDGENNTGAVTPEEAAQSAAKLGIKVYTIGVGSNSVRTPYVGRDFFGRSRIMYANTNFDEHQLREIAEVTGGKYFAVGDEKALENSLSEIDKLEKTALDTDVYNRWSEHFALFLLPGALLTLIAVTLSMYATRRFA